MLDRQNKTHDLSFQRFFRRVLTIFREAFLAPFARRQLRSLCSALVMTLPFLLPSQSQAAYISLLVGDVEETDSMKAAMLTWDDVLWSAENIHAMNNPTADDVLKKIESLLKPSPDLFFFGYIGHAGTGINFGFEQAPAQTPADEFLAPAGSLAGGVIYDDQLAGVLSGRSGPTLVALESCFSGGFWNGNDEDGLGDLEKNGDNTCLYAACRETQESYGFMWTFMIDGCQTGAADKDNDLTITVQEWFDFSSAGATQPGQLDPLIAGNIRNMPVFQKRLSDEGASFLLSTIAIGFVFGFRRVVGLTAH